MSDTSNFTIDPNSYRVVEEENFFATEKPELGKHEFLKLLVTQLENQDPLEPMQDSEFIAQLATFSSLEELQDLNTRMDSILDSQLQMVNSQSINLVGREVIADTHGTVQLRNDGSETVLIPLAETISGGRVEIIDEYGVVLRSIELGEDQLDAGRQRVQWDGFNDDGDAMEPGVYDYRIVITDASGNDSTVDGMVSLPVEGLNVGEGGLYLISGNRTLAFEEIAEIGPPTAGLPITTEEE